MKKIFSIIAITATMLLAGCATDFTSRVNIKQSWPADLADRSFNIETNPNYGDTDEFVEASGLIKTRLQELGFTAVNDDAASALKVDIYLNSKLRSPYLTPFFGPSYGIGSYRSFGMIDPFYARGYRSAFYPRFRSPLYSSFYMGRRYDPFFYENSLGGELFQHTIGITIKDATGKPLYMVSATSEHFGYEIYSHIPYLVQTALLDFPGKNGKYDIVVPLKK